MKDKIYYARPDGTCFHLKLDCIMLNNGQFEKLKYEKISTKEIKRKKLIPCVCTNINRR